MRPNPSIERTFHSPLRRLWNAAHVKRWASHPGARTIAAVSLESVMNFAIECELEDDGRWLAEAPQLPGVLAYGSTRDEAIARAQVLALRVLAERLEHGESRPESTSISVAAA